jgi:gamma-F420-2:alpha-L-glutamate ligase
MKIALISTMPPSNENERIGEEIKALGHEFVYLDFREMDLMIRDGEVHEEKLDGLEVDLVIVRGILSSIKAISALVKDMRDKGIKVFDNNFLEHEYSINKVTDMIKLAVADIPVPDSANTKDFGKYKRYGKKLGYPLIVKSTKMGKGVGVHKVDDEEELASLVAELEANEKKPKNYILQEFIPYVYDIRALIIGDEVFAMRRIPGEGEFRANFSLGGAVEPYELDKKGKKLAIDALSAINMSVGGVDILITKDDKRYILEVNHNAGFTGMEKATSKNIGKVLVAHAIKSAK